MYYSISFFLESFNKILAVFSLFCPLETKMIHFEGRIEESVKNKLEKLTRQFVPERHK